MSTPVTHRITDTCINWNGAKTRGYGCRTVNGRRWLAHRYAWFLAHGEIPDGLGVCHRCNNKSCVNVEHLYLANQSTNIADAYRDGLVKHANCKKLVCPKCEGQYRVSPNGTRYCPDCKRTINTELQRIRRAKHRVAIAAAMRKKS